VGLFVRRGYKVVDHRYPRDYAAVAAGKRNCLDPATHPFHRGTELHTLQSATKSVMATVLGAAIHEGAVEGVDALLVLALGQYAPDRPDPQLARATVADLLTMRTGIEWHEQDRPLDSTNTTLQLEASPDWVGFTLAQPMDAEPGARWVYNSGGSHLMGAVIAAATGASPAEYARRRVFEPLGIETFHWKTAGGGLPDGEGGLYLSAESLAKIGYLYLRGGIWDGRRILPAEWARAATSRMVEQGVPNGWGYGYQWWRVDSGGVEVWAALGFGGQFMLVVPAADLVVVSLAWNVYGDAAPALLGPLLQASVGAAR
jgi:CubicO group peptidase (beta-lactamase class C family)